MHSATSTIDPPRPRRLRLLAAAVAIGAITLALTACGTSTSADSAGGGTGTAIYRVPISDPGGDIDPLTVSDYNAMLIAGLASEGLVSIDAKGKLFPRLATSWEPSEDGLTWTVKLREGAEFNDGTPVTAKDVVSTFETITGPDSTSPGKSSFTGILSGVAPTADGSAVDFTLARPFSDFPRLLAGANTAILPAGYTPGDWLKHPVGAGQFVLDSYTVGESAKFTKNPKYWDAKDIKVDGVELKVYADPQAALLAFQAGEVDRIALSPDVRAAVDVSKYNTISAGYNKFDGIFLNQSVAPFNDPTVRQAVAWAIDRKKLIEKVYDGTADVANDALYFPDYDIQPKGLEQREQDLTKVAELLDGRTVSFTITIATENQLYGEVLQQQLNAVPGFDVKLDVLTSAQYYADGADSPWLNAPLTVTNWAARVPSQYIGLIFTTGADWNASHYSNPELEALSASYDATTDQGERQKLADQIAAIQWKDLAVIVPAFTRAEVLQDKRVQGQFKGALDFPAGFSFAGISIT
jgi:peptide/nickel transport system substrate-binding protein